MCKAWHSWAPGSHGDPFPEISNIPSPADHSKRMRITPLFSTSHKCLLASLYFWNARLQCLTVAWMAHWLALYPLSGSSRQEQLQVPQLPELSIFFWINMAPGCSKELADTEHRIWPLRLIKQRRRHQRLKSLPCISFHPFLQSLLHQNHTLPVRPPSQNHWGLLHELVVTEQNPGGTEHIQDSPCLQLTVQDGGAQGQSHWGQERERCQISSSL